MIGNRPASLIRGVMLVVVVLLIVIVAGFILGTLGYLNIRSAMFDATSTLTFEDFVSTPQSGAGIVPELPASLPTAQSDASSEASLSEHPDEDKSGGPISNDFPQERPEDEGK